MTGPLVAFRPVDGVGRGEETLFNGAGGDDGHTHVAMGRIHTTHEVGLLGLGGQAGGRAAALHVHHHQRDFRHPGQAEALAHQGDAGAGGSGHGLFAGETGAEDGGDGLDFGGHLVGELVLSHQVALHPQQDGGGRGDGIAGIEFQAGVGCAQSDGLVALEHHLLVVRRVRRRQVAQHETALGGVLPAQPHGLDVGGNNLVVVVAAAPEPGLDEILQVLLRHMHQLGQRADDDHVGGAVVARGAGQRVDGEAE